MRKILIVDDNDGLRAIIAAFLETEGYDCTSAADARQARRHLMEESFEVTISDFNMPLESGLDLLRYMAKKCPSTSFILMSGDTNGELKRQAHELGAVACMAKPFRLRELLSNVEGALQPVSSDRRAAV